MELKSQPYKKQKVQQQQLSPQQEAAQLIHEIISLPSNQKNDRLKRAYGCVLGAFIGDSVGSYCEFKKTIDSDTLDRTMKQFGGGTHNIKQGQLTDDSEMALALAYGLIEGQGKLDLNLNGKYYGLWRNSPPFDLGNTIGGTLGIFRKMKPQLSWDAEKMKEKQAAQQMIQLAKKFNTWSQSNGNLMRISPLVLYCLNMNQQDIEKAVKAEVSLFHSDVLTQQACVAWVLAQVEIINSGNASRAYEISKKYIQGQDIKEQLKKNWWEERVERQSFMPANSDIGWLKIAWTYGLTYLKQWGVLTKQFNKDQSKNFVDSDFQFPNLYQNQLAEVISMGGDTDTNACIVGSMLGALVGVQNLPEQYLANLIKCDITDGGYHIRGEEYQPYQGIFICRDILSISPKKLNLVD